MTDLDLSSLAKESLDTFDEISKTAIRQLGSTQATSTDSFASGNTLTGATAYKNLANIKEEQREALQKLCNEPTIVRLVLEDDDAKQRVIYISRNSNLALPSRKELASYRSPLGRLAEIPPGEEAGVNIEGETHTYLVIEKTSYRPERTADGWESRQSQYRHYDKGSYSIESLRALLHTTGLDSADELDQLLEQAQIQSGVVAGISHQVRTAMGLRDQPILDQFQGEIFRLPLDSQLMIVGPPGTGKTTTLIKRLGQKLDFESLEADERRIAEASSKHRPHATSWLMFTPSELLKQYLKEAFSREQVPASDAHIRTWMSFRNDIARNTLGILRSTNGGRFTLKIESNLVSTSVVEDARAWFDAFRGSHDNRVRQQLVDGKAIVVSTASEAEKDILQLLLSLTSRLEVSPLIEIYRALDGADEAFKQALADDKTIADDLLKRERSRLFINDKGVFQRLAKHLESLQQDNEPDEEELFDDDEQDETEAPSSTEIQVAVKAYLSAIKSLARTKYLKRSLSKTSRSSSVIQFLGDALPSNEVLIEIGRHISFQNGLRRFINSHNRYVTDIPSSYQHFRKDKNIANEFYTEETINPSQMSGIELDAIVLLMLINARLLLSQSYVGRALDEPRFGYLVKITGLFRNQVMVDEATDFSMLELACMANMATLQSRSFFACGDFNQRITRTGIRSNEQLRWVLPSLAVKSVQLVYRQSRKLNAFAEALLRLQGGDLTALGKVPEESTHEGVDPVLLESSGNEDGICWIAERIKEVERTVRQLPTIAVLVNSEHEVKPMAERLSQYLEDINLSAVACEEGKALGEGTDVRVFNIQHIKGLEFEAVFFAGIDKLAEEIPDLFDRYLYVGTTRAATYLGLVCCGELPDQLRPLKNYFVTDWSA